MKVRFVYENHCFAWSSPEEIAQLILGRDARRGIIRVADVNQTSPRGGKHFWKIMGEGRRQWHLHHFGAIRGCLFQNCFEGRIGCDKGSTLFPGECFGAEFQNLARTVTEQNLVAVYAVKRGQFIDQHIVVFIGIAAYKGEGISHCLQRFRRRSVSIFIRAQPHNLACCGIVLRLFCE